MQILSVRAQNFKGLKLVEVEPQKTTTIVGGMNKAGKSSLLERPFDQASATEQREAAFGIVAALNPSLRFAMIKDGSLLDDDSMADFSRIAAEKGFQLFIERVGVGRECTVIISDGETMA